MDYDNFSKFYDIFTDNIDYEYYSEKIIGLFEKYDKKPTILLDLACGTGGFSYEFAKKNIEVIGVDRSDGMLNAAINKNTERKNNPLFLNQSAEDLDLFGTVDGAVCLLDSVNHITDKNVLLRIFKKVSLFLEPERLFMFDVNTLYKHKMLLGDNTFIRENKNTFCVWQNQTDENGTVDVFLDFFVQKENGDYERFCEDFSEVIYSDEELKSMLLSAGFETLDVIDCKSEKNPDELSQRVLYIVRKIK